MLMRDSGFKLYRAIVDTKQDDKSKEPKEETKEDETKEERKFKEVKENNTKKVVTVDKELLMACSYFDLGHCGYFESKDLEDILQTMSFNLSRAQIKKIVAKVFLTML